MRRVQHANTRVEETLMRAIMLRVGSKRKEERMGRNGCRLGETLGQIWRAASRAVPLGMFLAGMLWSANANAGATFKIDDDKSLSVGIGLRAGFTAQEDAAGAKNDKWSNDFNLDN
ncbi:MAG TPA: hypothetical protein VL403_02975, partial [Candidatus Kryptonia bacterium]|nr:hypothetical protein [Candidatus Kryptonia bacterium]